MANKFKATNNNWKTRALFADVSRVAGGGEHEHRPEDAFYWLFEKKDDRPLLKEEFLKYRDFTGTKLAANWLGGWEHFQALLKCNWFKPIFEEWKNELAQVIKAEALETIMAIMAEGSSQSFPAAKYLANKEYEQEGKTSNKRGRPSKEEVQGELKNAIKAVSQTEEDYNRMMGLTVIQGGKATAHRV